MPNEAIQACLAGPPLCSAKWVIVIQSALKLCLAAKPLSFIGYSFSNLSPSQDKRKEWLIKNKYENYCRTEKSFVKTA